MSGVVCDCCHLFIVASIHVGNVCAGSMLLVLLMTMATASLSASFAVFLVRERANKSKHVQVRPLPLSPLFPTLIYNPVMALLSDHQYVCTTKIKMVLRNKHMQERQKEC